MAKSKLLLEAALALRQLNPIHKKEPWKVMVMVIVAMESWPKWDLNPWPMISVQNFLQFVYMNSMAALPCSCYLIAAMHCSRYHLQLGNPRVVSGLSDM